MSEKKMTKTQAKRIEAEACTYELLPVGGKTHLVIDGHTMCGSKATGEKVTTGYWDCMSCARKTPYMKRLVGGDRLYPN